MTPPPRIPYTPVPRTPEAMRDRAAGFRAEMQARRTVRDFSPRPLPSGVLEDCLAAACSAPSGANLQPWRFTVVAGPDLRRRIREAAEAAERKFYESAATRKWRDDLAPLGTAPSKPFLETAPALVAVFVETHRDLPGGGRAANPHALESACIALGILFAALHHAGLAALCYTPSPARFLRTLLGRPENERPLCLVAAGFPADGVTVPDIRRKPHDEVILRR